MANFTLAPDLERFAALLIKKHHQELLPLRIAYIYRKKDKWHGSKLVCGTARKVSSRDKLLHGYDAVIEIAKGVWDKAAPKFRTALIDHELCHLSVVVTKKKTKDGKPITKVAIRPHSIEEFVEIIERYSAYHSDLLEFVTAYETSLKNKPKKEKRVKEQKEAA